MMGRRLSASFGSSRREQSSHHTIKPCLGTICRGPGFLIATVQEVNQILARPMSLMALASALATDEDDPAASFRFNSARVGRPPAAGLARDREVRVGSRASRVAVLRRGAEFA